MNATEQEISFLDGLYKGRSPFHGEMHDHASTGGTSDGALTTIYAEEAKNRSYLSHLSKGDFACGPIGFQMAIGDTLMGGKCPFDGQRLVFRVGDFHRSVVFPDHAYRVVLLDDRGPVASAPMDCDKPFYGSFEVKAGRKFYRLEVFDETRDLRIGIGNPIWNR